MYQAYLIDPWQRQVLQVPLTSASDKLLLEQMCELIGADKLDHQTISDNHDTIWLDDGGLTRGEPIHAFVLPMQKDPYAGRAVVIGADDQGRTQSPTLELLRCLRRDIEWLGLIVPQVVWDHAENRMRAIVTYARSGQPQPQRPSRWEHMRGAASDE